MPTDPSEFSRRWEAAWNARDLDQLLSHFSEEIVFTSPIAVKLVDGSDGVLRGKDALRSYWSHALELIPDLRFTVEGVYAGLDVMVINYRNQRGNRVSEVLRSDPGSVCSAARRATPPRRRAFARQRNVHRSGRRRMARAVRVSYRQHEQHLSASRRSIGRGSSCAAAIMMATDVVQQTAGRRGAGMSPKSDDVGQATSRDSLIGAARATTPNRGGPTDGRPAARTRFLSG
jgi:ketosteroid isomerase-like protein